MLANAKPILAGLHLSFIGNSSGTFSMIFGHFSWLETAVRNRHKPGDMFRKKLITNELQVDCLHFICQRRANWDRHGRTFGVMEGHSVPLSSSTGRMGTACGINIKNVESTFFLLIPSSDLSVSFGFGDFLQGYDTLKTVGGGRLAAIKCSRTFH